MRSLSAAITGTTRQGASASLVPFPFEPGYSYGTRGPRCFQPIFLRMRPLLSLPSPLSRVTESYRPTFQSAAGGLGILRILVLAEQGTRDESSVTTYLSRGSGGGGCSPTAFSDRRGRNNSDLLPPKRVVGQKSEEGRLRKFSSDFQNAEFRRQPGSEDRGAFIKY